MVPQAFIYSCVALFMYVCTFANASSGNFLDVKSRSSLSTKDFFADLNASIKAVEMASSVAEVRRIAAIEKSIAWTFQALPKNSAGRLAPRSVRHIVHSYFAKEHGWLLEGLEAHTMEAVDVAELHSTSILQQQAPALVEALLEERQRGRGLALEDVVVMIEALEKLIYHQSTLLLEDAYRLNGLDVSDKLKDTDVDEVLRSYLIVFRQGSLANLSDIELHRDHKSMMSELGEAWEEIITFEKDARMNYEYSTRSEANPFKPSASSFEEVSKVVTDMAAQYGKWQDLDCRAMKEYLMSLDPEGDGRVKLETFYMQPDQAAFHFHETKDYLRSIGALEELPGRAPQVRIPNYVAGPTNCIARSAYYSVCCISECEGLMNELEGRVQAPTASAEQLLRLVQRDLSSSSVDAPRQLSNDLIDKLHAIADRHDGAVPLHGRLFTQWMHYAFPNECPYPQVTTKLAPRDYDDGKAIATEEEKEKHIKEAAVNEDASIFISASSHWSDDEVLPLLDNQPRPSRGLLHDGLSIVAKIVPLLLILRGAQAAWQAAVQAHRGVAPGVDAKKGLGHVV